MKTYETIENISRADTTELAERCRISIAAAKAVRAAAKLALKDREAARRRLSGSGEKQRGGGRKAATGRGAAGLAAEALASGSPTHESLAAETPPDYCGETE